TGFENARHAWSRQIRLDDASAPSLVSRSCTTGCTEPLVGTRPARQPNPKSLTACLSVIHTPHAIGIPTASQAAVMAQAGEGRPIAPTAAGRVAAVASCEAASRAASCWGVITYLWSTGLISRLQINPITNRPASTYIVVL